jgi:pilus assembly protein CpaC
VAPEVSSLDFANGLVFQGFNIPALSTRRVQTEIELESGQSFVIGGLLDNRFTDTLNKIPGLANIPLLGKLFESRGTKKNNTELMVLVTPELVRPIPAGQPVPEVKMPSAFMAEGAKVAPRTPGMETTGPVPVKPSQESVPVEQLIQLQKTLGQTQQSVPPSQFNQPQMFPNLVPATPAAPAQAPAQAPAPAAPAAAPPKAAGAGA